MSGRDPSDDPDDAGEESAVDIILAAYFRDSPTAARKLAAEHGRTLRCDPRVAGDPAMGDRQDPP